MIISIFTLFLSLSLFWTLMAFYSPSFVFYSLIGIPVCFIISIFCYFLNIISKRKKMMFLHKGFYQFCFDIIKRGFLSYIILSLKKILFIDKIEPLKLAIKKKSLKKYSLRKNFYLAYLMTLPGIVSYIEKEKIILTSIDKKTLQEIDIFYINHLINEIDDDCLV